MRIGAVLSGLAVAALVVLAVAGEARRRRHARAATAGDTADEPRRTVFAAETVDEAADRRINRSLAGYGVGAGAMVAGAGASVAYLAVISDSERGGPFYYAGMAGQIVLVVAALAVRFGSYPRLARLRMRKVVQRYAAGSATLDEPAAEWIAGQRRLLAVHEWFGVAATVTALPVLVVISVGVFGHHDDPDSTPLPYGVGIAGGAAIAIVLLGHWLAYRRIAWDGWVWGGAGRRSSPSRSVWRGVPLGTVATLVVVAAVGYAVGTGDPVRPGPGPAVIPPVVPSVPGPQPPPIIPTLPSIGPVPSFTVPSLGQPSAGG